MRECRLASNRLQPAYVREGQGENVKDGQGRYESFAKGDVLGRRAFSSKHP